MNPLALLLPDHRASASALVLGLVGLALLDALRLSYGSGPVPGFLPVIACWFFCFSLFANRRRHAGRDPALGVLPVALAILAKGVGATVGFLLWATRAVFEFAEERGVDTTDEEAMRVAMADPDFQAALQAWLETGEGYYVEMFDAGAWPSFVAFWVVIAVFGAWFSMLPRYRAARA